MAASNGCVLAVNLRPFVASRYNYLDTFTRAVVHAAPRRLVRKPERSCQIGPDLGSIGRLQRIL